MLNHYKSIPFRCIVLAGLLLPGLAFGAGKTWVGTTTGWGTASNWSPSGVPATGDDPTIPASPAGGNFPFISSGTFTVRNITIQAGATLTLSGGTLVANDLTIQAGPPAGTFSQSGGLFKLAHDWKNSGVFNATVGTVEFTGSASGAATFASGTNQLFNVIIDVGIDPHFDNVAGSSILIRGDFTNNNKGLDNSTNATFTFNGTGAQSISSAASAGKPTFGNLIVNKASGEATLTSTVEIKGNATVLSGTLEVFTFKRTAAGGAIAVSNGASLKIGGTNSFPANFSTHTLGASSTVEYDGTGQTASLESYGNLTLSGSNTKIMPGSTMAIAGNFTMAGTTTTTAGNALTVNGNFTLGSGTTFSAGSFSHQVKGNWSNAGTFNANTSTFTFNGTGSQTMSGSTFNKLTINNGNGIVLLTDETVNDTLRLTSGNMTTGSNKVIANGAVIRASGYVAGSMQKPVSTGSNVSRTFEIGATTGYRPINLTFASVSFAGNLSASVSQSAAEHAAIPTSGIDSAKDVNRYWTMTNSGIAFTNYNATFNFIAGDIDAGAGTNGFVVRRFNSPNWFSTTVGARTSTSTQATAVTSFSDYAIGDTCIPPTTANAGPDQEVCATTATIAGNTPTSGTGAWAVIAGSASVTTPGSPTSGLTGLSVGANTFIWTISTSSCGSSSDTVTITRDDFPTTANAGPDQTACGVSATLAGNTPTIGSGTWSMVSGPGTVAFTNTDEHSPAATATASIAGTYRFEWKISNGSCESNDTMEVVYTEEPTPADAGLDQSLCGFSATLGANTPSAGTGTWSKVSGPGSVSFTNTDEHSPAATATASTAGVYRFEWKISNGSCDSKDTAEVLYIEEATTANGGPDQSVCGFSATLGGNAPAVGTGTWSKISGPGTVTFTNLDNHSPGATAAVSTAGTYGFEWLIVNGICESRDTVEVVYAGEATTADAGSDQNLCGLAATLTGNTPSVGTGTWSKVSGPGSVTFTNTDEHSPEATASVSTSGSYKFGWTIANGSCESRDTVEIDYTSEAPTTADAGLGQTVCGLAATLAGNAPSVGTGTWSKVSGPGAVTFTGSDEHSPGATATVSTAGTFAFEWRIVNGTCESKDTVEFLYVEEPTTANAGPDQTVCSSTATLAANTPAVGSGTWTVIGGSATVDDSQIPVSGVSGLNFGENVFEWIISNGVCPVSRDTVTISRDEAPTAADAGPNQTVSGTTATMAGNTPTTGSGIWNLVSGAGTVTTPSAPGSGVTGLGTGLNVFRWTISNGSCTPSSDSVTIGRLFPTTSTLTQSSGVTKEGEMVTFRDSVAGSVPDGGSVQFKDGAINLGAPVGIDVNGIVTLSISSLSLGLHTITSHYGGTGNFDSSTSNSVVHTVETADTTEYRTATSEDWAKAADLKGKLKSVKRKPNKVDFKLQIVAPKAATGFTLTFNMFSRGTATVGTLKSDTLHPSSPWDSLKTVTFTTAVDSADAIQLDGRGFKGSRITVKVAWATAPRATTVSYKDPALYQLNQLRLPMPNLNNVGEELFPKGFGQPGAAFPAGLLVGVPQGLKGANSVKHFKFTDVRKSLIKRTRSQDLLHTSGPRCLDAFENGKPMSRLQKNLPPAKHNNKLFVEVLALKLNVAASVYNKFPNGLGELAYDDPDDPTNPFNGQTVNDILQKADTLLSCLTLNSMDPDPTLAELYSVVRKIDSAFAGPVDTITFTTKTVLTGIRKLSDVPFLHKTSGVAPLSFISSDLVDPVPVDFKLQQNYPNPFNPTTTIQFTLIEPAFVTLKVYDMLGQEVATLLEREEMNEGNEEIEFDAQSLSSGTYFYRFVAEGISDEEEGIVGNYIVRTKKMLLMK